MWLCRQPGDPLRPEAAEAAALAESLACAGLPAAEVLEALASAQAGDARSGVLLLTPEISEGFGCCRWDGDGRFEISMWAHPGPPSLDKVVGYVRAVDEAFARGRLVIHASSYQHWGVGAVLIGAHLILSQGFSARTAWSEVLRQCPAPPHALDDPAKAWDRFPLPLAVFAEPTWSSVSVFDCLMGLEAARARGWLDHVRFDVAEFQLLRRRFDASWVIPGELLTVGSPERTAREARLDDGSPLLFGPNGRQSPGTRTGSEVSECSEASSRDHWVDEFDSSPTIDYFDLDFLLQQEGPFLKKPELKRVQTQASVTTRASSSSSHGTGSSLSSEEEFAAGPALDLVGQPFTSLFRQAGVSLLLRLDESPSHADCDGELRRAGLEVVKMHGDRLSPLSTAQQMRAFAGRCTEHCSADSEPKPAVAVSSGRGLGFAALAAGTYARERHGVDGPAFHAWLRMCRPGSVPTTELEQALRLAERVPPVESFSHRMMSSLSSAFRWVPSRMRSKH